MADGFSFNCNWREGFVPDPTRQSKYGYLMAFNACGIHASEEKHWVQTWCNFPKSDSYLHPKVASGFDGDLGKLQTGDDGISNIYTVGVIESLSWAGSTADPICVSAYITSELAMEIKAAQKTSFNHTRVDQLSWWLFDYDPEKKDWFENAYPNGDVEKKVSGEIRGQVNKNGNDVVFNIASDGVKIHPNLESMVYNIYFETVPGTDELYTLGFNLGKEKKYIKPWGVQIGKTAQGEYAG